MSITARSTIPAAEALLGTEVRVLDHGFVIPVDYMGGDVDVVAAARASHGPSGRAVMEDTALLRYLMRHRHTSPFEMVEAKWVCRMPLFVARQWIRHRTANVNEEAMAGFVRAWVPECWASFEEYRLGAVTFGATERRALHRMYNGEPWPRAAAPAEGLKGRELEEFCAKVETTRCLS
jgi:hypothetical protein